MDYISENDIGAISGATGAALRGEERVRIVVEAVPGEEEPWVGGLNGYFFRIKRGVEVEVPRSIAALIAENARISELASGTVSGYKRGRGVRLSS